MKTRHGQTIPVAITGSQITTDDPQYQGTIFVVRNITERKRAERRIRYLARYDALTKVPNRMQFQHLLQQAIARAIRNKTSLALLYLDMDRFKEINDTFGHAAGDRTLEILTERLTRALPQETVIGRLAGDEFAHVRRRSGRPTPTTAAPSRSSRAACSPRWARAFQLQEHEVFLTASIGIAFCPRDAENVIDLIRNADAAMYHSKQNGGNTFAFYSPGDERGRGRAADAEEQAAPLARARRVPDALPAEGRPARRAHRRRRGAAALAPAGARRHSALAVHSARRRNQPDPGNRRVGAEPRLPGLSATCSRRVTTPGRISLNLSLKQLRQASFILRFRSVFRKHGVSPDLLRARDHRNHADGGLPSAPLHLLDELYAMGLHLSIDDFGTGYSSLSALQQFPIGTLKIDQSFVRDVDDDESDATIVRTIIEMGRSLKMNVIAEGVESLRPPEFPAPPPLRLRPGQAVRRAGDARRAAPAAGAPAGNRPGVCRPDRAVGQPRQDRQAARRLNGGWQSLLRLPHQTR